MLQNSNSQKICFLLKRQCYDTYTTLTNLNTADTYCLCNQCHHFVWYLTIVQSVVQWHVESCSLKLLIAAVYTSYIHYPKKEAIIHKDVVYCHCNCCVLFSWFSTKSQYVNWSMLTTLWRYAVLVASCQLHSTPSTQLPLPARQIFQSSPEFTAHTFRWT